MRLFGSNIYSYFGIVNVVYSIKNYLSFSNWILVCTVENKTLYVYAIYLM